MYTHTPTWLLVCRTVCAHVTLLQFAAGAPLALPIATVPNSLATPLRHWSLRSQGGEPTLKRSACIHRLISLRAQTQTRQRFLSHSTLF